jgi:peroxiredoxin
MELLRDRSEEFRTAGAQVYAISRDQPWTHVAWMQALDLNFPLLADFNGDATRGFDVGFDFRGLRDVAHRSAFLIDSGGIVRANWLYGTSEVPDLDELLEAVRTAL